MTFLYVLLFLCIKQKYCITIDVVMDTLVRNYHQHPWEYSKVNKRSINPLKTNKNLLNSIKLAGLNSIKHTWYIKLYMQSMFHTKKNSFSITTSIAIFGNYIYLCIFIIFIHIFIYLILIYIYIYIHIKSLHTEMYSFIIALVLINFT